MKKLLLIAFIGLSVNSYAQNKCNCPCKNKVVHHKAARAVKDANIVSYGSIPEDDDLNLPDYVTVLPHVPNTYVAVPPAREACRVYRQHNIMVKECPGTFYDSKNMEFNSEGSWLGYYPGNERREADNLNGEIAPQHTVINNAKGVAPADGNSCNGCKPQ